MKKWKRAVGLCVLCIILFCQAAPVYAAAVSGEQPYLALGSDLSQEQLASVLDLMGLTGQDFTQYNIVNITNAEEHQYLGNYLSASVIGSKSLSSVLVRPAEAGHGVVVTTKNINYCTTGMYRNALLTAGVENADILVAAPSPMSGTAALIGALKAYEQMTGETVSAAAIDTAMNELVTTGELAQLIDGNSEQIEEIIAYVKAQVASKSLETEEEIEGAIREGLQVYNVSLADADVQKIVDLMMKIKSLGIDFDTLVDQAGDLYEKYGDKIKSGDFSLSDIKLEDLGIGQVVMDAIGNFFTNMFKGIVNFFENIFG